jgi:hypothetical protein
MVSAAFLDVAFAQEVWPGVLKEVTVIFQGKEERPVCQGVYSKQGDAQGSKQREVRVVLVKRGFCRSSSFEALHFRGCGLGNAG